MWISIKEKVREFISNTNDFLHMLASTNLPKVAMLMLTALILGGATIMIVEGQTGAFSSFFASIWWVLVTMTTVGYGDMVPVTPVGRVVATVIILAGVILVSTFTATVSSIFVAAKIREGKGLQLSCLMTKWMTGLRWMKKQFWQL
jgi:voltage-gated potassium channel